MGAIRRHFAEPEERIERYKKLGSRKTVRLHTGHSVYVRCASIDDVSTKSVLDSFTLQGVVPEPVRAAKLLARAGASFARTASRTLR